MRYYKHFFALLFLPFVGNILSAESPRALVVQDANKLGATLSINKQIVVAGKDLQVRGAVAMLANGVVREIERVFPQDPNWKHRIEVELIGNTSDKRPPNPFARRLIIEGNTRIYRLSIHLGQGILADRLECEMLELILLERALREIPNDELPENLLVPPWIVIGSLEAIRYQRGEADRVLYQRLFEAGDFLKIDEILKLTSPETLDSARKAIFSSSSAALVMALTTPEGGGDALATCLQTLVLAPEEPRATLQRNFPSLNFSQNSLDKWWALQLANMATPQIQDSLSIQATEEHLAQALQLTLFHPANKDSLTLILESDIEQIMSHPGRLPALAECNQRLSHLSVRCFPTYRPFILQYTLLVNHLMGDDQDDAKEILAGLNEKRQLMQAIAARSKDYLDWYQITHPDQNNASNFRQYLQAIEMLRQQHKDLRDDPISRYLDQAERFLMQNTKESY